MRGLFEILPCAQTQGRGTMRSMVEGREGAAAAEAHAASASARFARGPSTAFGGPPPLISSGEDLS